MTTGQHAAASTTGKKVWDLVERVLWTFVQAFVGALIVTNNVPQSWTELRDTGYSAAVAGIAALVSLAKVLIAQRFGNGTGATLPASLEP